MLSGGSVSPTSQVHVFAMLLLLLTVQKRIVKKSMRMECPAEV